MDGVTTIAAHFSKLSIISRETFPNTGSERVERFCHLFLNSIFFYISLLRFRFGFWFCFVRLRCRDRFEWWHFFHAPNWMGRGPDLLCKIVHRISAQMFKNCWWEIIRWLPTDNAITIYVRVEEVFIVHDCMIWTWAFALFRSIRWMRRICAKMSKSRTTTAAGRVMG